jgi:hypothetical protein
MGVVILVYFHSKELEVDKRIHSEIMNKNYTGDLITFLLINEYKNPSTSLDGLKWIKFG